MTNDTLPDPISDIEIIAETFQAIRTREFKTVDQVKEFMLESFPEIDEERRQGCLVKLANMLCQANAEAFSPEKQRRLKGSRL